MHPDYRVTPEFVGRLAAADYQHVLVRGSILREFPEPELAAPWRKAIRAQARADKRRLQTHVVKNPAFLREGRRVVSAHLSDFKLSDERAVEDIHRAFEAAEALHPEEAGKDCDSYVVASEPDLITGEQRALHGGVFLTIADAVAQRDSFGLPNLPIMLLHDLRSVRALTSDEIDAAIEDDDR